MDSEFERRARGIGEARAKARRRMERAVAWLRKMGACDVGLKRASCSLSPEHAILSCYPGEQAFALGCVDEAMGTRFELRWWDLPSGDDEDFVERIVLHSPEWHSLPWQRDPLDGQVSHG